MKPIALALLCLLLASCVRSDHAAGISCGERRYFVRLP